MNGRVVFTALGLALLSSAHVWPQAASPSPDAFAEVRFLVGRWRGSSEGQPGQGAVTRTYEPVLQGRFIHERNRSEYPAQKANPKGEVHEHWSVLSYDRIRKTLVLRQFHQEGFVNTYRQVERRGEGKILVFETEQVENLPGEWKARETYERLSADELIETFELAAPGKPFEVYSRTRLRREK